MSDNGLDEDLRFRKSSRSYESCKKECDDDTLCAAFDHSEFSKACTIYKKDMLSDYHGYYAHHCYVKYKPG